MVDVLKPKSEEFKNNNNEIILYKKQKQQFVLNYIGSYYEDFQRQTKDKLIKLQKKININEYSEIVSNIVYSIVEKLDNEEQLDRFYLMAQKKQLHLYIYKAITYNCSSNYAPFLREVNKRNLLFKYVHDILDSDLMDDEIEFFSKKQQLVKEIKLLLEPENAKVLFGDHWKYFVNLFNEYVDNPKASYRSLGKKYNIPWQSIGKHIVEVKNKIRAKLIWDELSEQIDKIS